MVDIYPTFNELKVKDGGTVSLPDESITSAMLDSAIAPDTGKRVTVISVEDLAADADIAARPIFAASADGNTLTKIGIVPQGASAGIDNDNTSVIAIKDGAGNTIVSKTYNTGTQPPASGAYASLGTLDVTHKVLTANEVVTLTVTNGTTADLPAFLVILEWTPTAA